MRRDRMVHVLSWDRSCTYESMMIMKAGGGARVHPHLVLGVERRLVPPQARAAHCRLFQLNLSRDTESTKGRGERHASVCIRRHQDFALAPVA